MFRRITAGIGSRETDVKYVSKNEHSIHVHVTLGDNAMLDTVFKILSRRNPKQDAMIALARIMSRFDVVRMGYEQGINQDHRSRLERHVALGVWLFPFEEAEAPEDFDPSGGVPAVTHDLRAEGFGVMTPMRLSSTRFLIAVPGECEEDWRMFATRVRHNTRKPGGWYQLGLQIDATLELEGEQRIAFRRHIASIHTESGIG